MKFLHNDKNHQVGNKRGGMLVMVLMIFAVSLILISSAMTITLSARSRYYVNTVTSQERLTLSCAAEAVIDAVQFQEITDDQLQKMAATNGGQQFKITGAQASKLGASAVATDGSSSIAPGLSKDSASNTTYFTAKYDTSVSGSKDVILEFHTNINVLAEENHQTENLRVKLKYDPAPNVPDDLCANMVTAGDDDYTGQIDPRDLMVMTDMSYSVFHGDVRATSWSQTYLNNVSVFTGAVEGLQGTLFMNDVIIYGKDAYIKPVAYTGGFNVFSGDTYFLGVDGKQKAFNGATPNGFNYNSRGIYFYNSDAELGNCATGVAVNQHNIVTDENVAVASGAYIVVAGGSTVKRSVQYTGAKNVIVVDGDSSYSQALNPEVHKYSPSTVSGADATEYNNMKAKADNYISSADLKKAAETTIPTSESYSTKYGAYASKSGTNITGGKADAQASGHYIMSAGTYSNGTFEIKNDSNSSIYISGNVTLNNFIIKFSNSTGKKLTIVLAKNATLTVSGLGGIVSCDDRYHDIPDSASGADGYDLRAKSAVAGGYQKPAARIIGLGGNTVNLGNRPAIIDAYVSLAGKTEADKGTFTYEGNKPNFYGRIESLILKPGGTNSGQFYMEYCPGVNEESGNEPEPLKTDYVVQSYEYYY